MKKIKYLIFLLILLIPLNINAAEKKIDFYLFYGDGCPHCKAEKEWIKTIEDKYPIKVHYFETWHDTAGQDALIKAEDLLGIKVRGVPFTVVMDRKFTGFSTSIQKEIESAIEYCLENSCKNPLGTLVGNSTTPPIVKPEDPAQPTVPDGSTSNGNNTMHLPLLGEVAIKDISIPIVAVILGIIDGFNPCAMWILLFLIGMLLNMENKRRRWTLGISFLLTSAVTYTLFMVAWLNITSFIGMTKYLRVLIAVVALVGGFINLRSYFKTKEAGCEVTNEKKRKSIFNKIKNITGEKKFYLALLSIIVLAFSVNLIELLCSAGLPLTFTSILSINNLSIFEYSIYIFIYMLFFLLDDLIVFVIAMKTLEVSGMSNKYAKVVHLIGGILMIIMALLMVFKPEWLMFSF